MRTPPCPGLGTRFETAVGFGWPPTVLTHTAQRWSLESDSNRHCLPSEDSVSYQLDYPGIYFGPGGQIRTDTVQGLSLLPPTSWATPGYILVLRVGFEPTLLAFSTLCLLPVGLPEDYTWWPTSDSNRDPRREGILNPSRITDFASRPLFGRESRTRTGMTFAASF